MSKPYVFVTMNVPEAAIKRLEEVARVSVWPEDRPVPRERLLQEAAQADAILSMLSDSIDEELLSKGHQLKIVANMAVGYDNIDVAAAKKHQIAVSNTPDVLTEATADLTFALLMATARRVVEASEFIKEGKWVSWSPLLLAGKDIYGATLGIVGMGRIGEAVAKRAQGFGMKLIYHNRSPKKQIEKELGASYSPTLDALLQEADYVVVLTPLRPETRGMFGARQFQQMKRSAVLINASRGPVVDEQALYEALISEEIWAAGLDVFEQEPISNDHPLLQLKNVVALPHIGSASVTARTNMALLAADNIIAVLTGKRPPSLIVSN